MLPRHRRRPYLSGIESRQRSVPLMRLFMIVGAVAVIWYGASMVLQFFDRSIDRKTATSLEVRSADGVRVSLQGQEWQPGETGLRLYGGDAVSTRSNADAVLQFFDGTRIRLGNNTDVEILRADRQSDGVSTISLSLRTGRVFFSTPSKTIFTGAILRTMSTENFHITVPAGTFALIDESLVNVLRAGGIGAEVTLQTEEDPSVLFVGEGQYFALQGDVKSKIAEGADPYDFRDPVTSELLRDPFLTSSYSLFLGSSGNPRTGTAATVVGGETVAPLTVLSPQNRDTVTQKTVTVSGKVNKDVVELVLNGQPITVKKDGTFSAEVSLSKDPTTLITVEAKDAQGITLSKVERIVTNAFTIVVEAPRIKSPVGSGQTLTTSDSIIEITGEAPPNTAGILVNDYRLQLFKPGGKTWSYLANAQYGNLAVGENIFSVVAVDADGNRSASRSIRVMYQPASTSTGSGVTNASSEPPIKQNPPLAPGTLTVDLPSTGQSAETSDEELSIIGKTSSNTYSISVNGYTLALYQPGSTQWKYIASINLQTMKRGKNVYRIVSRNSKGEILDILEYTLTYRP